MSSSSSNVDTTYTRIERNTVRSEERDRRDRVVKDEVYTITGLGGSILILSLLVSLAMVRRYKRKLMENSDSTTFRRNSVDFGPSFQHSSGDNNSLTKIYSLIKSKEEKAGKDKDKDKDKDWLNPLAKLGSEVGSGVSRVTRTTLDEDRARSAGEEMDVDQNPAVVETQPVTGTEGHPDTAALSLMENVEKNKDSAVWGVADTERGKLLLEIYNGGTFKKSMNYHSFREQEKRSSREVSIDNLETDSLEISGSQLTVLPPSETSRRGRSRLSDIFPDILNFKSLSSGTERPIPSPDYPSSSPEKSLSTISEQGEKTVDEKPVTHTQYYFGDHVMKKKPEQDTETTRVKFNLDLRSAIIHLPRAENREEPEVKDGLSSLDILPENTKPSLNRARLRQLYESQTPVEDYDTPRRGPPVPVKTKQKKSKR